MRVLYCYWCGREDVHLGKPCPSCGVQLEILVRESRTLLNDCYVHCMKEITLAEDARWMNLLSEMISEVQDGAAPA